MVAVRVDSSVHRHRRPASHLRVVPPPARSALARPPAVVVTRPAAAHPVNRPVLAPRLAPEVYRRRRLVAAGLVLLTLAALVILVEAVIGRAGGGPLATTGAGTASASARVWVVQPGQTLWGIASTLEPRGDARPLVAHLVAETGSPSVYPGERITIP